MSNIKQHKHKCLTANDSFEAFCNLALLIQCLLFFVLLTQIGFEPLFFLTLNIKTFVDLSFGAK